MGGMTKITSKIVTVDLLSKVVFKFDFKLHEPLLINVSVTCFKDNKNCPNKDETFYHQFYFFTDLHCSSQHAGSSDPKSGTSTSVCHSKT